MEPAIELSSLTIDRNGEPALARLLDWRVRDRAVTVLLGPAATGKSTLLRTIAGVLTSDDLRLEGSLFHRGRAIDPRVPTPGLALVAQRSAAGVSKYSLEDVTRLSAETLVFDEPDRALSPGDLKQFESLIRDRSRSAAVVVVTHDLAFARRVGDDFALLCAGVMIAQGSTDEFFDRPASELHRRFLREGNCWPPPDAVSLPKHFRWLEPGKLAGMGRPGLLRDVDEDLTAIAQAGICHLVSLTQAPFPKERLRAFGICPQHLSIRDMDVPGIGPTASLCKVIDRAYERGEAVAVHCDAGLGRTGTLLAAFLVWRGMGAGDAVAKVRAVERGYIQTRAQEMFVERFAEAVGQAA